MGEKDESEHQDTLQAVEDIPEKGDSSTTVVGVSGVKQLLTETVKEIETDQFENLEGAEETKKKDNEYEEIKDPQETDNTKKTEENIYEEIPDTKTEILSQDSQTDFNAQKDEAELGKENDYEEIEDPSIEEVEMKRIADEELMCIDNLRAITDQLKRKISGSNKSRNKFVFEKRTFKTVEEVKETVATDLNNVRRATQTKQTVVIQQTIITIVETVSNWLDKVEYRISTVKRIKTVNQKKEELKSIKEEIEVIEETVDELVEVTEMAVEVIDDES